MRGTPAALLLVACTAGIAWLPAFALPPAAAADIAIVRATFLGLALVGALAFFWLVRALERSEAGLGRRATVLLVFGLALALRLPALFAPPWLSDDLWRYLWEGSVQRAGFSPYVHAPDDPGLAPLQDEIHTHVTHRDVSAVYPPAAQLLFRWMPASPLAWKSLVTGADLLLLGLLLAVLKRREQPLAAAALYGWHPLVALEFAGSGHVDAIALLLLVGALVGRGTGAGLLAGVAGMVKPQGFVALAGLVRNRDWRALAAAAASVALLVILFHADGSHLFDGISRYAHHWEFNGFVYPPLVRLAEQIKAFLEGLPTQPLHLWRIREFGYAIVPNQLGRKLAFLVFLGVGCALWRRVRGDPARLGFGLLVAFIATTPAVHPWYCAWIVPLVSLLPRPARRAALLLSVTTLAAYVVQLDRLAGLGWHEPRWVGLVTWLPPALLAVHDLWGAGSGPHPSSGLRDPGRMAPSNGRGA